MKAALLTLARVKGTSLGSAHLIWALLIAGWGCGNERFRNGRIEGKTSIGFTDTGLPGGQAELGPPRVQVR